MRKGLLFFITLIVALAVSCDLTGNKEPQHTHSFKVTKNGELVCSGCEEIINKDYVAIIESGIVKRYKLFDSADVDSFLSIEGSQLSYVTPPDRKAKNPVER